MTHASREIQAIPLWINGHAFLTMAPAFCEVREVHSGQTRRRTPLCGAREALAAATAARAALDDWSASSPQRRAALLAALGEALADLAEHFAGLISEESGKDSGAALAEVEAALALLRVAGQGSPGTPRALVAAVVSDQSAPLLGPLRLAVPLLLGGATLIVKPSPQAPSAAFALAELTACSDFPAGVYNILHGDLKVVEALCSLATVDGLACAGDSALSGEVQAIAARHSKPIVG
ncbi:MAG: aldehyde dehydrogenase family protein [Candidatus Accumulibacter sp.]|uniref:aldehyde dehydrogenase family protein n=1 Tax=Accumulibacter sp. TaxID=2053492 RepID=UPI002878E269|nr:aldehyde dehydrogenase family protein [Accumulibacter sp.]MDS4012740.1 aldehyde dehydrogenase family protein [Accumulibacter sp.]